jgi:hypothetical protein
LLACFLPNSFESILRLAYQRNLNLSLAISWSPFYNEIWVSNTKSFRRSLTQSLDRAIRKSRWDKTFGWLDNEL